MNMIPEDVKQCIKDEVENKHPFAWPLNRRGEPMTQLVGQSSPPGSRKHKDKNEDRCKWAEYGYSLAQEEIDALEDKLQSEQIMRDACEDALKILNVEIERLKGLIPPITKEESQDELWKDVFDTFYLYQNSDRAQEIKQHFSIQRK